MILTTPLVDQMTFLDFSPANEEKSGKTKRSNVLKCTDSSQCPTPADRILNRAPPKIEAIKSSDVLSRAAAFLPQLAASNRAILQKRPEDINIEVLNEKEEQVIEMKLGLGVFEERRVELTVDTYTDSSDSCPDPSSERKLFILPSELRAARAAASSSSSGNVSKTEMDPFDRVINSLLLFDSEDESSTDTQSDDTDNMDMEGNVLEFE